MTELEAEIHGWLTDVHTMHEQLAPTRHSNLCGDGPLSRDTDNCNCGGPTRLARIDAERALLAGMYGNPWLIAVLAWGWRTTHGYQPDWAPSKV